MRGSYKKYAVKAFEGKKEQGAKWIERGDRFSNRQRGEEGGQVGYFD